MPAKNVSRRRSRSVYRRRRIGAVAAILVIGTLAVAGFSSLQSFADLAESHQSPSNVSKTTATSSTADTKAVSGVFSIRNGLLPERTTAKRTISSETLAAKSEKTLKSDQEQSQQPQGPSQNPLDILILGVDQRPEEDTEVTGSRSDSMMLVRILPATGEIKLLSVPRDLLVEISPGQTDKINASYSYYGSEGATRAVEKLTGIQVDHYVIVDFDGFEQGIDALGGVRVNVKDDFPDNVRIKEGPQKLSGSQALKYARYRGTPGGDLYRIQRQQKLIRALRHKALRWDTVTKLPAIVRALSKNVKTDLGISKEFALGRILVTHGRKSDVETMQLKGTPDTLPDGNQVLIPDDSANQDVLDKFQRQ